MTKKYLNQFLEEVEIYRSPHTFSAYKRDLQIYSDFLKTKKNISFLYEYINKQGFKARSKARIISSVRAYFRFLESQGKKTDLKQLSSVPVRPSLPSVLSAKEFQKLYQVAKTDLSATTARNHITLFLLFGLGCRISEVIQLNRKDINKLDHSLIVTGKRNKQRMLPLTKDLFDSLNHYIQIHRPALLKKGVKTDSVLINNRGQRPSRVDVWRWLSLWSQKAGFKEVKSPHQFRHGFAVGLLEGGADLRSIQVLLGHSSIQTTQIYTSVRKDHLKKTIKDHHPLSTP